MGVDGGRKLDRDRLFGWLGWVNEEKMGGLSLDWRKAACLWGVFLSTERKRRKNGKTAYLVFLPPLSLSMGFIINSREKKRRKKFLH